MIQRTVREFVKKELMPLEQDVLKMSARGGRVLSRVCVIKDLQKKARAFGGSNGRERTARILSGASREKQDAEENCVFGYPTAQRGRKNFENAVEKDGSGCCVLIVSVLFFVEETAGGNTPAASCYCAMIPIGPLR